MMPGVAAMPRRWLSLAALLTVGTLAAGSWLAAPAQELALESGEGLELVNVIAAPDTLESHKGIKITADPEIVRAAAKARQEAIAAAQARGETPRRPSGDCQGLRLRQRHD